MSIAHWPPQERPRERLISEGPGHLTDAELVAILLRTGRPGVSALDLARGLLTRFGGLVGLFHASLDDYRDQPGIGREKYALFQAHRELSQRYMLERIRRTDVLSCSAATREYLRARYRPMKSEVFSCLFLNNQHHIVRMEDLFQGTIDGAAVYPREVVRRCLELNAAAVIFAHNHPSGVAEPSQADIAITRRLKSALDTIDVRVLDHFVVGDPEVVSFAERGLL